MRAESFPGPQVVDFIGWALLHSLWQGVLVAMAVAAALVLLRNRAASLRYGVAYAGLLLMLVLPGATAGLTVAGPDPLPPPAVDGSGPATAASPTATGSAATPEPDRAGGPVATVVVAAARILDPVLPWLVAGWVLGVALLSIRLAGGWVQVQRLRRRAVAAVPAHWQRTCDDLARRLAVSRPVRLVASARLRVPMACGWLRPMVVVPVSMLTSLPPAQVETLLAHELAHVRRHDYLFNLLQAVVEILLFYHPATAYVSGRVREEREHCCDDLAVAACGDPRVYARALAGLEELRALPAPALAATGTPLLSRVRRLLLPAPSGTEAGSRLAAVAVLAAVLLAVGLPAGLVALPALDEPAGSPSRPLVSTAFTFEDEMRVQGTCEGWEKVRRCVDAGDHGRFECTPRSPLAALLAPYRERQRSDDEVRVEVVRRGPEGASADPRGLPVPLAVGAAGATTEVRRIVGDLPSCRDRR